jgi:hypothetical protein
VGAEAKAAQAKDAAAALAATAAAEAKEAKAAAQAPVMAVKQDATASEQPASEQLLKAVGE